jgi:putative tryptophan/tyrosine transport system substrate-binding protein
VRRREFISLLGGTAVAWPLAARAQQATMPVIGLVRITTPEDSAPLIAAFRQGLGESGFVELLSFAATRLWEPPRRYVS